MQTVQTLAVLILTTIFSACNSNTKIIATQTIRIDTATVYINTTANLKNRFIPDSVFQMANLRVLSIQGMDCDYGDLTTCWAIGEIPEQIGNLKKLETLQLNVNAIKTLPKEIRELKNLKSFDLTDNQGLSNIDNLMTLTNLERLSLFGCGITKLPIDIEQLKSLKYLGLTGNAINTKELERVRKALPNCKIIFTK